MKFGSPVSASMRLAGDATMAGAIGATAGRDSSVIADDLVRKRCSIIDQGSDNRKMLGAACPAHLGGRPRGRSSLLCPSSTDGPGANGCGSTGPYTSCQV